MYTNIIYSFIHFFLYVAIHSGEKRPGWWKPAARQMLECELAEGQREFLNRRYTWAMVLCITNPLTLCKLFVKSTLHTQAWCLWRLCSLRNWVTTGMGKDNKMTPLTDPHQKKQELGPGSEPQSRWWDVEKYTWDGACDSFILVLLHLTFCVVVHYYYYWL